MKFDHIGIPTQGALPRAETHLPDLQMYVTDYSSNKERVSWIRFEEEASYPLLVLTKPHVAFRVDDIEAAIKGKNVIVDLTETADGLTICMIEDAGVPVKYMQYTR